MTRLIAIILFCAGIFCIAQSHAQVPMTGAGLGKPASGFTPATLPGLLAWYKADAGLSLSGSNVTGWADQTSNHYDLLVPATPPTSTLTLNGLPVVSFGGATGMFTSANPTIPLNPVTLGGTTTSMFMVVRVGAAPDPGRIVNFFGAGETNDVGAPSGIYAYTASTVSTSSYRNGAASAATTALATWYEIFTVFDGANVTMYLNNSAQTPAATSATFAATGTINLGNDSDAGTNFFTGDIAEVVITNTGNNSTDRSNMHTYFTNKWGT